MQKNGYIPEWLSECVTKRFKEDIVLKYKTIYDIKILLSIYKKPITSSQNTPDTNIEDSFPSEKCAI